MNTPQFEDYIREVYAKKDYGVDQDFPESYEEYFDGLSFDDLLAHAQNWMNDTLKIYKLSPREQNLVETVTQ